MEQVINNLVQQSLCGEMEDYIYNLAHPVKPRHHFYSVCCTITL